MKKTLIQTVLLCLLAFFVLQSCEKKEKKDTEKHLNYNQKKEINVVKKTRSSSAKNDKENINHLSVENGGSMLYMKNGERRSQARFDTDGDFVTELLKVASPHGNYKDFNNYIIENKDTLNFFEDYGKISSNWEIIKGKQIFNDLQLVSFVSPKEIKAEELETITSTNILFISPEIKKFKDENSQEAQDYFTVMDDWNYYSYELREYFKKIGISSLYTNKRFWKFEIENNKTITVDTKNKINNYLPACLLYKKGKTPIIVYLITSDNNLDAIKYYLK